MGTLTSRTVWLGIGLWVAALGPDARAACAQTVEMQSDSLVTLRLVNTDLRAALQAIGRFMDKPVLAAAIGEVRVEVFETPAPVPRAALPALLRGLVGAHGLTFEEDSLFYRVSRPPVATEPAAGARAGQAASSPLRLFTVRLRHARAADVAATVNQLYGAGQGFSRPAGLSTGSLSDELRADRDRAGGPGSAGAAETGDLRGLVTLVPDELTNSLLIRASEEDFALLEEAVVQLDVRPLQVLIEVVVVEARKDRQFALGFDVEVPPRELERGTIEGSLLGGGLGDLVVRVMGLTRAQINATLTAARLRGDVEILSRPVLLASNNTEARLLVGTQQPFIQVSRSLPTETPQRDQVVQYRDVGTKLTVRPTINQDGYVSMLVQQEISAATGETQFNAPVISSRETVTQVLVADRQTIVIGGLTDEVHDQVRTGIPLLVDIPLLGGLFGGTRTRTTETELFLFITPTIIRSDADIADATLERLPDGLLDADFIRVEADTLAGGASR
ncbi:MAG: type II secretion system protein GspD [Sandaracinaceae bacterium]